MKRHSLLRSLFAPFVCLGMALNLTGCPEEEEPVFDPCDGIVCENPPGASCDGSVIVTYSETGTCHDGLCEYAMTRTPCPAGQTCENAQCVPDEHHIETCADIEPCVDPPADYCDGNVLVTYESEGTCQEMIDGPICVYASEEEDCGEAQACEESQGFASCVPIQVGETCADIEPCDSPPENRCDPEGGALITYPEQGVCEEDEDGAECIYEPDIHDCGEGYVCEVVDGTPSCVEETIAESCDDLEPCDSPPASYCDEDVLVTYEATGTCEETEDGPICVYQSGEVECLAIERVCIEEEGDASCVDLCAEVSCPPRDDHCDGDVMVTYSGDDGTCDWQTGECLYSEEDETLENCGPSMVCELDESGSPQCLTPICGLAPPPASSIDDGGYCAFDACQQDPACEFGYNFDFDHWVDEGAPGFYLSPDSDVELSEATDTFVSGAHSARLESTATANRDLRAAVSLKSPNAGAEYTFHLWFKLEEAAAGDWVRAMLWLRDEDGSLHREGETSGNYWSLLGDQIFGPAQDWTETTLTTPAVEADRVDLRPLLRVQGVSAAPTIVHTDAWALTLPYDFTIDENTRDGEDTTVASAGDLFIGAALNNSGVLYVSTNGAGALQDRFLYVWIGGEGEEMVDAPWAKLGAVAGPAGGGELLALLQDEGSAYCEWVRYDSAAAEWELLSTGADDGTCTNVHGNVLSGVVDLSTLRGEAPSMLPSWISVAAAGYGRQDGEAIQPQSRVPSTESEGYGDIAGDETQGVHRASILAGKVY